MSNAVSLRTPKYRRHKGKGLAVVTLGGRDIYLGKYGSAASKQEYRRLVAEYVQNGGTVRTKHGAETTVAEVMAAYLKFAKGYYRKAGKITASTAQSWSAAGLSSRSTRGAVRSNLARWRSRPYANA